MTSPTLDSVEAAAEIVYRVMPPTPQYRWPLLCARTGADVWVKHENHTPVGAFKIRGGLVFFEQLKRREPDIAGVISATRGNHGQSVALAATRAGLRTVIVVPQGNSVEKNAAMRSLGAELIEHGSDFQEAYEYAAHLAEVQHLHFVRSFGCELLQGVATYSLELFRAVANLDAVYVPIGLGSGICGCIAVRDALGLRTEIIGVVAASAPAYALSYAAGRPVAAPVGPTVADGMACREPDPAAVEMIARGAARVVTVDESEIRAAMRHLFSDTHNASPREPALSRCDWLHSSRSASRCAAVVSASSSAAETWTRRSSPEFFWSHDDRRVQLPIHPGRRHRRHAGQKRRWCRTLRRHPERTSLMPKFAANLSMLFTEVPFLERFGAAARCGFRAVEFLFPYEHPPEVIAEQLREHNLQVVLFNMPPGDWAGGMRGMGCIPGCEADFRAGVDKALAYATVLGTPRIHAMAGLHPGGVDRAACRATLIANLKYAAEKLAPHNITVLLEAINHRDIPGFFVNTQAESYEICTAVGAPNLKMQMDLYHMQVMEGDIAIKLRQYAPQCGHIQIAGAPQRHEPDTGEVRYEYLFQVLDEIAYDGWIGCEYRPAKTTAEGMGWFQAYK